VSVYSSRRVLSHIRVVVKVCSPIICTCMGICGRAMHRDLLPSFYSRRNKTCMKVALASVLWAAEQMARLVAKYIIHGVFMVNGMVK